MTDFALPECRGGRSATSERSCRWPRSRPPRAPAQRQTRPAHRQRTRPAKLHRVDIDFLGYLADPHQVIGIEVGLQGFARLELDLKSTAPKIVELKPSMMAGNTDRDGSERGAPIELVVPHAGGGVCGRSL